MKVSEIMSRRPITLPGETSLDEAMQLMDDQDIRHLPVMDGPRVVGIVSDRDLLSAIGWLPRRSEQERQAREAQGRPSKLRDIVHHAVSTIDARESVQAACSELYLQSIGCLPVLDDGVIAGIVTEMDVLMALAWGRRSGQLDDESDPPVSRLMTHDTATATPSTTFEEASALCAELRVRHLPVVDEGRLVGIVSDRDLRAAAGDDESGDTPIERIMSSQLLTLDPDDLASRAAERMVANRVSSLPIDVGGALVGLITSTDLLEHGSKVLAKVQRAKAPRH